MNRIETFMSELADLMDRHRVEIDVNMDSGSYDIFDCIEFTSEPDWENEEEPRYQNLSMYTCNLESSDIRDTLERRRKMVE